VRKVLLYGGDDVCLLKALLWHGLQGIIAAFVFWAVHGLSSALGVSEADFFYITDQAIAYTFAGVAVLTVVYECFIDPVFIQRNE
jgi:hypothetical protein